MTEWSPLLKNLLNTCVVQLPCQAKTCVCVCPCVPHVCVHVCLSVCVPICAYVHVHVCVCMCVPANLSLHVPQMSVCVSTAYPLWVWPCVFACVCVPICVQRVRRWSRGELGRGEQQNSWSHGAHNLVKDTSNTYYSSVCFYPLQEILRKGLR